MDDHLFSRVTCDYYTRRYEFNSGLFGGLSVIVYAECYPNITGTNNHYYGLDLYFSADGIPVRDHIIGVSFGAGQMDKKQIDAEMDRWVEQVVDEDTFPLHLKYYMRKEKMWEEVLNSEATGETETAD